MSLQTFATTTTTTTTIPHVASYVSLADTAGYLQVHSNSASTSAPPSYGQAQLDAQRDADARRAGIKWITVECLGEPSAEVQPPRFLTPLVAEPCDLEDSIMSLPKIPEFYGELSKFDIAHADLQDCARAICYITDQLIDLQNNMSRIHDYWMEVGMHDIAHDLIPVLDKTKGLLPRAAFPPAPCPSAPSIGLVI